MSVEEPSIKLARDDRCEECGLKLTAAEAPAVRESGGPALCAVHATEDEPGPAGEETESGEG